MQLTSHKKVPQNFATVGGNATENFDIIKASSSSDWDKNTLELYPHMSAFLFLAG